MTDNFLGRSFDQICFVVPNLEDAVSYWRATNGINNWSVVYDLAKGQIERQYRGQPDDFQFSCAFGFAGDTLIELARHDGGQSVYKDWIDSRAMACTMSASGWRIRPTMRRRSNTIVSEASGKSCPACSTV